MTQKKNSGDNVGFKDIDKVKWKNPSHKPIKLISELPEALPKIDP
ncbi:hypothetical protein [Nostoc sp. KVJ3]|nr:hypothetical protein [Nostoc sp. KVJ3]